jgi:hypothetical protein
MAAKNIAIISNSFRIFMCDFSQRLRSGPTGRNVARFWATGNQGNGWFCDRKKS